MKTFRLLALLPLISAQALLGQTTSPVSPDSTSGTTTVNFTGASANKGAGEDTSAGGTSTRIPVDPQAAVGATNTAGIVTSGVTTAPAATTNTTTISGSTTGTVSGSGGAK